MGERKKDCMMQWVTEVHSHSLSVSLSLSLSLSRSQKYIVILSLPPPSLSLSLHTLAYLYVQTWRDICHFNFTTLTFAPAHLEKENSEYSDC